MLVYRWASYRCREGARKNQRMAWHLRGPLAARSLASRPFACPAEGVLWNCASRFRDGYIRETQLSSLLAAHCDTRTSVAFSLWRVVCALRQSEAHVIDRTCLVTNPLKDRHARLALVSWTCVPDLRAAPRAGTHRHQQPCSRRTRGRACESAAASAATAGARWRPTAAATCPHAVQSIRWSFLGSGGLCRVIHAAVLATQPPEVAGAIDALCCNAGALSRTL